MSSRQCFRRTHGRSTRKARAQSDARRSARLINIFSLAAAGAWVTLCAGHADRRTRRTGSPATEVGRRGGKWYDDHYRPSKTRYIFRLWLRCAEPPHDARRRGRGHSERRTANRSEPLMKTKLAALIFLICIPTVLQAQTTLDNQIKPLVASFKGKVSLYAKNLDTGETYALNADERVRTASTIKIAVMIEAFARVNEGKIKWTDEVVLTKEKKVSGSGILAELSDNLHLTLRDAVKLMMILSDNTATNLVLDVLTTDAVNARMESLGFKQIKINRKVMSGGESMAGKDPENKKYGLGFATPHEMVLVMEKLERGQIISPAASKEMLDLMKEEQARFAIGRSQWDLPMAGKYGALDKLRSAVGIIYSKKGNIAMAISCDDMPEIMWSVDNPAYLLMSQLSEVLVNGLGK